jgi:hypothetical protein
VESDGEWLALFLWGSAAYRLKDRDAWIGWNDAQRAQRQKLIVQNRRFVRLEDKTRSRNPQPAGAMTMLRNILLFFFHEQEMHTALPGFVEAVAADSSKAYSMLKAR